MALSVEHLNADSTFLLTFSSDAASAASDSKRDSFTILTDPWLAGASSIWTPKFSISHHACEPLVTSLADIPLPDLIVISQDKSDHCHEATLRTLPADSPVRILAIPAAARKIRSWKYFTHATIESLPVYNHKNPNTVLRYLVEPSKAASGRLGEITITYIPQRLDVTNLHNVIGITYIPPSVTQPRPSIQLPLSPPMTPVNSQSPAQSPTRLSPTAELSVPPLSSLAQRRDSIDSTTPQRPVSVLYAPHGIGIPCISPFMKHHLSPMSALPLTLMFHCINVEQNPWFLGGIVNPGLPGGAALAKTFGVRNWLSAHDGAKDTQGWATAMIKSRAYTLEEAQVLLDDELERAAEDEQQQQHHQQGSRSATKLLNLGRGERLTVTN